MICSVVAQYQRRYSSNFVSSLHQHSTILAGTIQVLSTHSQGSTSSHGKPNLVYIVHHYVVVQL